MNTNIIIMASLNVNDLQPLIAILGLRFFFSLLVIALAISPTPTNPPSKKLFLASYGRSHRMAGAATLAWLLVGAFWLVHPPALSELASATTVTYAHAHNVATISRRWAAQCLSYDIILGLLGITATLTAARDFPHRHVINRPGESGTLSHDAMVTQDEMVEHAFYQGMNLWQAVYLNVITWVLAGGSGSGSMMMTRTTFVGRMVLLWIVTLPWAWRRSLFPVNSFSANWKKMSSNEKGENNDVITERKDDASNEQHRVQVRTDVDIDIGIKNKKGSSSVIVINNNINRMYQVKKWQYVFYKHVILHGLNISVALFHNVQDTSYPPLPLTIQWRIFWLALNTSYVMEFFLQSMVKRGVMSQTFMMFMNGLLMTSSSVAAAGVVLGVVRMEAAFVSLVLNFWNRGHDIMNTMVAGLVIYCWYEQIDDGV